jgi:hypothetical protein
MGLEKTVTDKGITVNYWMIDEIRYFKLNDVTEIKVRGYVNKNVRDANINDFIDLPEFRHRVRFSGVKTQPQAYDLLKSESEGAGETLSYGKLYGATDILEAGQTKE